MWYDGVELEFYNALTLCDDNVNRANISYILVCSIMHKECDIEYTKYVVKKYFHSTLFSVFSESNSKTIWLFARESSSSNQHELPISMSDMQALSVFSSSIRIGLNKMISKEELYRMGSAEIASLILSVSQHKGNDFLGLKFNGILNGYSNKIKLDEKYSALVKLVNESMNEFIFVSDEYRRTAVESMLYVAMKGSPARPVKPNNYSGNIRFTVVDIVLSYYGVPVKEIKLYEIVRRLYAQSRMWVVVHWNNNAIYTHLHTDMIVELAYYFLHNKIFNFNMIVIPNSTSVTWGDLKKFNLVKSVFGFNLAEINSDNIPASFLSEEYND